VSVNVWRIISGPYNAAEMDGKEFEEEDDIWMALCLMTEGDSSDPIEEELMFCGLDAFRTLDSFLSTNIGPYSIEMEEDER
jgi:hypothetical protein